MSSTGGIAAIKSLVPGPVKSSLRGARRALRDRVRAVSRRITRPNLYRLSSPERVGAVYGAPTDMSVDEKFFLYSFVRGFRPQRSLEIGVAMGGSALITANAMEENRVGLHVGVDPTPNLKVAWSDLHGRFKLIAGRSPEAIPEARDAAGGPFEFVLIDGLHRYDQVRIDIAAILPHLADGAYLLFHDAFHYGVATAIREAIEANPSLVDCGYPCRTANVYADPVTPYNGFRLLRWTAAPVAPRSVDVEQVLEPIYAEHRRPRPPYRADLLNHDIWYCKAVSPCDYCRSQQAARAASNGG
jgi:predicted O-methyltransferase YrrM